MPAFEGNGVSLFYEAKGSGQPVFFVHGTLCDYRSWSSQTTAVSSSFKTIAYSRRYAYPNTRKGDVLDSTVQKNAADLATMIRWMGFSKAHVVGYSYGGFVAAFFALQYRDLLQSLTLINAAVGTMIVKDAKPASALKLLFTSPSVALSARTLLSATSKTIEAVDSGDRDAANRVFVPALQNGRSDLPRKPPDFAKIVEDNAQTIKEATTQFPVLTKSEAGSIGAPTLVMWGEKSAPWDSKVSKLLRESIPNSESAEIEGAGHFCQNEKPTEVNGRILAFLKKYS